MADMKRRSPTSAELSPDVNAFDDPAAWASQVLASQTVWHVRSAGTPPRFVFVLCAVTCWPPVFLNKCVIQILFVAQSVYFYRPVLQKKTPYTPRLVSSKRNTHTRAKDGVLFPESKSRRPIPHPSTRETLHFRLVGVLRFSIFRLFFYCKVHGNATRHQSGPCFVPALSLQATGQRTASVRPPLSRCSLPDSSPRIRRCCVVTPVLF